SRRERGCTGSPARPCCRRPSGASPAESLQAPDPLAANSLITVLKPPRPGGFAITPGGPAAERGGASRLLLGLLQHTDDAPALGGRQRPGLHQEHPVADAARAFLVVRLDLLGPADRLAVERVLDPVLDGDDDRLLHLVADDQALADLAEAPGGVRGRVSSRAFVCHALTPIRRPRPPGRR